MSSANFIEYPSENMDLLTTTIMISNPGIIQKRFRTLLGSKYHIQQVVTKYGSIKYYNSFNKPPQKQISDSFSSLIFSIFLEIISTPPRDLTTSLLRTHHHFTPFPHAFSTTQIFL